MRKVRVKILEPIAVLADPKPKADLEAKYKKFADGLREREKPPSESTIKALLNEKKLADRYAEVPLGFARDMAWKIGDEAFINAELAEKWQDGGICLIIDEASASSPSKKAAA